MSKTKSFNEPVPEREKQPSRVKLGVVARLRREVGVARSNKELATMVADFARITNRSTGRTVSKVCNQASFPAQNFSAETAVCLCDSRRMDSHFWKD